MSSSNKTSASSIGLYSKTALPETLLSQLLHYLHRQQVQLFVPESLHTSLQQAYNTLPRIGNLERNTPPLDLMISLGGDGTLLEAVQKIGAKATPLLGINTGRMGFLARVSPSEALDALAAFMQGAYSLDPRTMLQLQSTQTLKTSSSVALNEVAILKQDSSSMITIHLSIDGQLQTTYWADGLIVATPTGSTAYSLSCGGPILLPHNNSFLITPLSPHNLAVRPLVVPDNAEISLRVESRNNKFLISLDGRTTFAHTDTMFKLHKAPFHTQLVRTNGHNLFDVLRQKLHWGLDIRN